MVTIFPLASYPTVCFIGVTGGWRVVSGNNIIHTVWNSGRHFMYVGMPDVVKMVYAHMHTHNISHWMTSQPSEDNSLRTCLSQKQQLLSSTVTV